MAYTELPLIETSTPQERLMALRDAKDLMSGPKPGGFAAMFNDGPAGPGSSATAIDGFIRLAEYITTGHDYRDTHPEGKRRPIIKNITVHAHPVTVAMDEEEVPDFIKDLFRAETDLDQPDTADDEESPTND